MWARHLQSASDAPQRSLYLLRQAWGLQSPLESLGQAQGASCLLFMSKRECKSWSLERNFFFISHTANTCNLTLTSKSNI